MLKICKNCRFQRHSAHCVYFEIETIFDYSDDSIANIVNYVISENFTFLLEMSIISLLSLPYPLLSSEKEKSVVGLKNLNLAN